MTELRILTVRQPWATAILTLGKDIENRSRNIAGTYRGPVAIHSSAQRLRIADDTAASKRIGDLTGYIPLFTMPVGLGTILGVVDLLDVHESRRCICSCSDWADADAAWHMELRDARRLAEPIPYKGALGLRRLPDDVAAAVWAGVAA